MTDKELSSQDNRNWDQLKMPEKIELTKKARTVLRRIRASAIDNSIDSKEMHQMASHIVEAFGNFRLGNKTMDSLEQTINDLPETIGDRTISHGGQGIRSDLLIFSEQILPNRHYLAKREIDENTVLVMPLSTGPILMALSITQNNIPLYYSAVSEDYSKIVISPDIPKNKSVLVMDDVVGRQSRLTTATLEKSGYQVRTTTTGLL
jgi:hypothetical protein